jgi:hypothetical protein
MLKKDISPTVMQDIVTTPPTRLPIDEVIHMIVNKEVLFNYTMEELRKKKTR